MKFEYKSAEEIGKMSAEDQNKYLQDKTTHETAVRKDEIEKAVKPVQDDVTAIKASQKTAGDDISAIKDEVKSIGEQIKSGFGSESMHDILIKAITEKHEDIKNVLKVGSGIVEITVKAPALITTSSGTVTGQPAIYGVEMTGIDNANLRRFDILSYVTTRPTSMASYAYTEALPKDGDFAVVAEGAVKPQIDFTWETRYASPLKIAAWEKLTEESVQDIKGLESVARDYLRKKHDIKKSRLVLFGTGASGEPKGATVYGKAFVAGSLAASVSNPNFMDVINAGIVKISTTHNYLDEEPYLANVVLLNPIDFFINYTSAKDGEGRPLYPMASVMNQVVIGGVTIKPEESIPVGKIFIGDLSKYNVTDYIGYTVKIGWVNDDFIKNQFVILGESRFHAFVKKLDEQAFIYDDIATIKTAITKP